MPFLLPDVNVPVVVAVTVTNHTALSAVTPNAVASTASAAYVIPSVAIRHSHFSLHTSSVPRLPRVYGSITHMSLSTLPLSSYHPGSLQSNPFQTTPPCACASLPISDHPCALNSCASNIIYRHMPAYCILLNKWQMLLP